MKTILEKIKSRKLLSTLGAYAMGAYLIRQGNITEGVALITGAQASFNIGQGLADAKRAEGVSLTASIERTSEPVRN